MKRLIALGIFLIVGIELLALILHDRRLVLAGSGLALALVLLNVRRMLGNRDELTAAPDSDDLGRGCAGGSPTPRRRSGGRSPLEPTGTGICVRCSHDGSKSPPAIDRPKTRLPLLPPAECFSATNCGMGQPEQCDAHRRPSTRPRPCGTGRNSAEVRTGMTQR